MSRVRAVRLEVHTINDENEEVVQPHKVSDYSDEVTQDDIDRLHAHVASKFGTPKFLETTEPKW